MAGMKIWVPGEEVLAADLNSKIQTQVVAQFTSTAQRDSQWPTPPDGALSVDLSRFGAISERNGGAWGRVHTELLTVLGAGSGLTSTARTLVLNGNVPGIGLNSVSPAVSGSIQIDNALGGVATISMVNSDNTNVVNIRAQGVNSPSSIRYKRDVEDLGDGLDAVERLRAVRYRSNRGGDDDRARVGLIAEEAAAVVPEVVALDPDGRPDCINYAALVPVLVDAIQTLAGRVRELERSS